MHVHGRAAGPGRAAGCRRPSAAVRLHQLHVRRQRVLVGRRRGGADRVAGRSTGAPRTPCARPTSKATRARNGTRSSPPTDAHLVKFRRRRGAVTSRDRGFAEQSRELEVRELERPPSGGRGPAMASAEGRSPRGRLTFVKCSGSHGGSPTKSRIRRYEARGSAKNSSLRTTSRRSRGKCSNQRASCSAYRPRADVRVPQQRHRVVRGIVGQAGEVVGAAVGLGRDGSVEVEVLVPERHHVVVVRPRSGDRIAQHHDEPGLGHDGGRPCRGQRDGTGSPASPRSTTGAVARRARSAPGTSVRPGRTGG